MKRVNDSKPELEAGRRKEAQGMTEHYEDYREAFHGVYLPVSAYLKGGPETLHEVLFIAHASALEMIGLSHVDRHHESSVSMLCLP